MTKTVKESFSSQIISYSTTGTTLSSFVNCESGFDPYSLHQCLILSTDGKPGIIEVAVPKTIIKDISDASASGFWGESLKFQRGYSGVSYNYIKVEVPANQGVIINGYSWDHGPVSTFLFASFLLWVLAWLATVFVVSLIERGISKIRSS